MMLASRPSQRLGFRLAFLLAVALLPLGVISALQANALLHEARARSEAALLGATRLAASEELRTIERSRGAVQALAQVIPDIFDKPDLCMKTMAAIVESSNSFSFASFFDLAGRHVCNSTGQVLDNGLSEAMKAAIANPVASVSINRNASVSRTSVLIARHPVFGTDGALLGFAVVSVPHSTLELEEVTDGDELPLMLLTFNQEGDVITSSVGFERYQSRLPKDRALAAFVSDEALTFTAVSNSGTRQTFSVVPLVPDTLYALGSWPLDALPSSFSLNALPPFAVPAMMWLVSLAVAIVATERLVTQHIKKLTRAITTFARGNRIVGELDFAEAPEEIRAAGDAFQSMTGIILRDEAELENMVHQREVLLREVHHRVKNNLQLIASIMNMQARRAHTPEAKAIVRRLQDRIMSLATIHRGLYQTSGLADVRADELLQDILRQIVNMASGPGNRFDISTDLASLRLTPDQAVPLALLVTEALTNAMKYSGGKNGRASLRIELTMLGDTEAKLVVANSTNTAGNGTDRGTLDGEPTGLGTQLVAAFVQQLDGSESRTVSEDEYRLEVRFPVAPLNDGEDKSEADIAQASATT